MSFPVTVDTVIGVFPGGREDEGGIFTISLVFTEGGLTSQAGVISNCSPPVVSLPVSCASIEYPYLLDW